MLNTRSMIPLFLILFSISFLLFLCSHFGYLDFAIGISQRALSPIQKEVVGVVYAINRSQSSPLQTLQDENNKLQIDLEKENELEKDNQALQDQFQTPVPMPKNLMPAHIIGFTGFVPGVSPIRSYVIDVGSKSGVSVGQAVVYENNLIGLIAISQQYASVVTPITASSISFTAQTERTKALGIVMGNNNIGTVLNNVELSDTLSVGDLIVTKGSVNSHGIGLPPGLIVGKIISVNKTSSALFQSAQIESLVNAAQLSTVFVITSQ